jgi:hypothetical protein
MLTTDTLIDTIRNATAASATPEQKTAGAAACRALLATLGTAPGTPLVPPRAPHPLAHLAKLPPDKLLDLIIAKVRAAAEAQEGGGAKTIASERKARDGAAP